jgi:hypothetical protein
LSFHPGESMSSQNNAFSKGIVRYKQWRPDLGILHWNSWLE